MSGKGDKWRKDFNYQKFWDNWDNITKTETDKKHKEIKKLKHQKVRYIY